MALDPHSTKHNRGWKEINPDPDPFEMKPLYWFDIVVFIVAIILVIAGLIITVCY